jgi:hypothetical protein
VSRTDATTSAATSRQRTARIAWVAHHAQAKEKNGSSKTAGTPVRDRSPHSDRRAIGLGASIVGPERLACGGDPAAP